MDFHVIAVRKLWSSDWWGQPYPGPDFWWGQTYVLAPFTNNRADFWWGHGPPGPPYNYLTALGHTSLVYQRYQ